MSKAGKVGDIRKSKYGKVMEIVKYKNENDITVQFSDGPIINTTYQRFLDDEVRVSIYKIMESTKDAISKKLKTVVASEMQNDDISDYKIFYSVRGKKNYRVGEIHKANNGQEFKIVAYTGCNNVSIMFEDGTIVNNRKYCHIKKGEVRNPKLHGKVVG